MNKITPKRALEAWNNKDTETSARCSYSARSSDWYCDKVQEISGQTGHLFLFTSTQCNQQVIVYMGCSSEILMHICSFDNPNLLVLDDISNIHRHFGDLSVEIEHSNITQVPNIPIRDKVDSRTLTSEATRATDKMDVILVVHRTCLIYYLQCSSTKRVRTPPRLSWNLFLNPKWMLHLHMTNNVSQKSAIIAYAIVALFWSGRTVASQNRRLPSA